MRTPHLALMFAETVAAHPHRVATREPDGRGSWIVQTYAEFDAAIARAARGFIARGVDHGDRVGIFAHNSPTWSVADLALLRIGAVPVPIYPSSTPDPIRHILNDCGAVGVVVEGQKELDRLRKVWDELDGLGFVIAFHDVDADDDRVHPWSQLGDGADDCAAEIERRLAAVDGTDLASIIYTSGTTGDPKGVMLRHDGFVRQIASLDEFFPITVDDHSLCFLPLSHALERAWTFTVFGHGCMNTYVTDPTKVVEMLADVKPTLFVCVPRLYEKVKSGAEEKVSSSPAKKRIYEWAMRVGGQVQRANRKGKQANLYWRLQLPLADKLVFSSIREAIGGPKTVLASGGAPLREDVEEFFSAAGILLCQGYGMTEASPLISFNAPGQFKFGTCGHIMGGGEVRIGLDSEIFYRGPNVMSGYWNNPEATAEALDDEGWLRTGDAGYVDTDGFLVITDRLKDILITSGGKNIAPQPIEGMVLADPLIEQAVLLGDNRPFVTLLVTPSFPHLEEMARQMQIQWANRDELLAHPQVLEELKKRVAAATEKLPSHEQIKDLRILVEEFTQENGLLTPTLKVKRREVEKRFGEVIDDMYARLAALRRGKDD